MTFDEQLNRGEILPLMEAFYTIQGEGYHTGKAAYFLRLGGCDVGCHWCDVKESWDANLHPATPTLKMIDEIPSGIETIVITGGEPLAYNLNYLTEMLHQKGFQVHIETSGAYPVTGKWDWFCLSPKKNKLPVEESYLKSNELKMIIHNQHDFVFAEEQAALVNTSSELYLQPEWSKREKITPLLIDYVMANPKWKISLQTHKFLNIP